MSDYCSLITCLRCGWTFDAEGYDDDMNWTCVECGAYQIPETYYEYCDDCQQPVKLEKIDFDIYCPICELEYKNSYHQCPLCIDDNGSNNIRLYLHRCPECTVVIDADENDEQIPAELVYGNKQFKIYNCNARFISESLDEQKYYYAESQVYAFMDSKAKKTFIGLTKWDHGLYDVKAFISQGPVAVRKICHGLSNAFYPKGELGIGIYSDEPGISHIELRQARIRPDSNWSSSTYRCTLNQLNDCAGLSVSKLFFEHGAINVATKQKLFNDNSSRRLDLCMTFESNNETLPVLAFVISRLLPLYCKIYAI